ncbi:MAG: hypothetical protein KDD01_07190 [Phaeodactylibacter sp.]|nr:hypothetical protein [Phaeodactylibacter sp.]
MNERAIQDEIRKLIPQRPSFNPKLLLLLLIPMAVFILSCDSGGSKSDRNLPQEDTLVTTSPPNKQDTTEGSSSKEPDAEDSAPNKPAAEGSSSNKPAAEGPPQPVEIRQSKGVKSNTPIEVIDFKGLKEGQFLVDLNMKSQCYNVDGDLEAIVDLDEKKIYVSKYRHFSSTSKNDQDKVEGDGTKEIKSKSDDFSKIKLELKGNKLELTQLSNACGNYNLTLLPSSWEPLDDLTIHTRRSKWKVVGDSITVFDFPSSTQKYFVHVIMKSGCYGVNGSVIAIIDLKEETIKTLKYRHFASKNDNDEVEGNGTKEISSKSDAYSKIKLELSGKKLILTQSSSACGGMLMLLPSFAREYTE